MKIDERAPEHSLLGRRLAPESPLIIRSTATAPGFLLFPLFWFIAMVVIKFFVGFRDFVPVYQKPWNLLNVGIWKVLLWFWLRVLPWDWNPRWGGGSCQS